MSVENNGRFDRVVGLYPESLLHRRNTDHLYFHALKDLYTRLGKPFEVVSDRFYNVSATLYYQTANRAARAGFPGLAARAGARQRTLNLPRHLVRPGTLYHGAFFGLPANVPGNIVHETEFYDFSAPDSGPLAVRPGELTLSDLPRLRAVLVRTRLSQSYFHRKYPAAWHHLAHVVPFHMPYLARWESRIPVKPDSRKHLNFIFVGNQARRKGLDLFIRFAREVRLLELKRELRFMVVSNFQDGTGFDLEGMEVHRGLSGEQVQDLMEQAHFLMLPTRADSHPKVCYEAAATGCGLIISDIRPLRDVWSDGGFIFPIMDGEGAMAGLAASICSQENLESWGQRNRERFLNEFSPSASVKIHKEALGL